MKIRVMGLALLLATGANAAPPNIGPVPEIKFTPPKPERIVLSNGVVVYVLEDHELPLFDLSLDMKITPADEPADNPDAMDFMGRVWRAGGTKSRPPEKLNEELEQMAASVESSASSEAVSLKVSSLSKDWERALAIFADVLLNPTFEAKQLSLAKASSLESLRRKNETPDKIGRRAFRDVMYGRTHIYAQDPSEKTINAITRPLLVALHKKVVTPDHAMISVAGDFNRVDVLRALESHLGQWKKTGRALAPYDFAPRNSPQGSVFLVQKDFSQSRISVGRVGVPRHHPDHFSLELADYILGGGGASRLFGEIRSRLGLAYVVGSFVTEYAGPGMIGVICQTKADSTVEALQAIRKELEEFSKGPISTDELELGKESLTNSFVFRFDSTFNIVSQQAALEFFGYPNDYLDTYTQKIGALTSRDVLDAARKYYNPGPMKAVIVGDKLKFEKDLKALGEVREIPLGDVD